MSDDELAKEKAWFSKQGFPAEEWVNIWQAAFINPYSGNDRGVFVVLLVALHSTRDQAALVPLSEVRASFRKIRGFIHDEFLNEAWDQCLGRAQDNAWVWNDRDHIQLTMSSIAKLGEWRANMAAMRGERV